jgi:hypothetical protein
MGMGGMPQNMGQMRPNFPQAWAELQCLTRRVVQAYLDLGILHTVGRVWGAVSSCFQQEFGANPLMCSVDDNDTLR